MTKVLGYDITEKNLRSLLCTIAELKGWNISNQSMDFHKALVHLGIRNASNNNPPS